MRAADALIQTLTANGVDRIFALSGNQIMPIFDACLTAGMAITHCRHEAAAVYMAEGHAQLTGQVGVALVTAGAGFGNTIGALMSARASDTPLLLLSGDAPRAQDRRGAFQELDQCTIAGPVTKATARAANPADLAPMAADLLALARADRPGPVHLALPVDVTTAQVPPAAPIVARDRSRPPTAADIETVQAALDAAHAPLILTGPSLSATRAPDLGCPRLSMESPRGLLDPAHPGLGDRIRAADLILALAKPVDFTLGFGDPARIGAASWITVSTDPELQAQARANLGDRLIHALTCDPRQLARALTVPRKPVAKPAPTPTAARPDTASLTSETLCAAIARHLTEDTVSVIDGGEFGQWAQALIRTDTRIINGPSGAIGASIPYAIAARIARPDGTVLAFMGDGTAGFHLAEFETAVRENTPFVAIIGNDRRWNAEHLIQTRDFGPDRLHNCTLSNARYDLAVAALGGHGEFVTRLSQLDAALTRAIASGKPACINVSMDGLPAPTLL